MNVLSLTQYHWHFENRYVFIVPNADGIEAGRIANRLIFGESGVCRTSATEVVQSPDRVLSTFVHVAIFCRSGALVESGVSFTSCSRTPLPLCELKPAVN
jgi:hypothetical protein